MNTSLTFAQPQVFWALLVLPVLAFFFIRAERARAFALERLLAARLRPKLAGSVSVARRRVAFALFLLGLAFCVAALARPLWGVTFEETSGRGRDIIIAMDTSRSMLAQDLTPNRLERAKLAAIDLLGELPGDRVGLIAFAGEAFLQAPLTPDHGAVTETLRQLDTEAIGQGGTNLTAAIQAADEAFGKGESTHRALVLFSDGEDLEDDALESAGKLKDKFRIFTIGVGTETGGPIPRPTRAGTEYMRDPSGAIVTSKLDESRLREVAKLAGGIYLRLQNGPAEMRQLAREGFANMSDQALETKTKEVPQERFQWPLVAGLIALATSILLGERRRVLRLAVASLLLCLPPPAEAGWLGRTIGRVFNHSGDSEETPGQPETPADRLRRMESERVQRPGVPELDYNVGCAAFAAGDFDKAASAFSNALGTAEPALKARAAYNLGNALARRGAKSETEPKLADWNNAVQQYNHALLLDPANEPAKKNRDIVQQAIDELKKKEEEKKKEEKKDQQKDQKDSKDQKDQKGQQDQKDQKDQKDKKDQQSKSEQKNGDKKDGDQSNDQDQQKPGEKKEAKQPKPGEKGDPKDEKPEEGEKQDEQKSAGDPSGKPKDGKLQQAGEPQKSAESQKPDEDKEQQEATEAAQAAKEGRMTDKDARALLDAMRKYKQVLPPLKQWEELRRRPRSASGGKDW